MDNTSTKAVVASASRYRWVALGLLVVAYVFSFLDRQIFSILQQAIKTSMNLSDTELGLLGGLTFALFFTAFGIPIARLADNHSRSKIIAISLALWSVMTALCGATTNFLTLALARVGVGIGEAGCAPSSHSLIADYFPRTERSTAFGIYTLGIPIGAGLGLMIGGYVNDVLGWREAFVVVGLPGLLLALILVFALKEPPRGLSENLAGTGIAKAPSLGEAIKTLWKCKTFVHMTAAFSLNAFGGSGASQWYPSLWIREFHLNTSTIGLVAAISSGLFGALSTVIGGLLADRLAKRDLRWTCWLPAIALFLSVPLAVAMLFQTSYWSAVPFMFAGALLTGVQLGPVVGTVQTLAPLRMRALASSILLFLTNLIGLGLGPLFVGMESDLFLKLGVNKASGFGVANSLRFALLINFVAILWAVVHYLLAARTVREDVERANALNA